MDSFVNGKLGPSQRQPMVCTDCHYFKKKFRLRSCVATTETSHNISLVFPPVALCTGEYREILASSHLFTSSFSADNAAMIAWAAMERFLRNDHDPYTIDLRPSWSIEDLHL